MDRPLAKDGFIRAKHLPKIGELASWRSLPAPASPPLRDQVPTGSFLERYEPVVANSAVGKTVALFPGCMTDRLFPDQGLAIAETFRLLGVRVVFPEGLNCCGLPAFNMGDDTASKRMARQTIRALEASLARIPADYIVSGSASCVATLAQDYEHLFRDEPTWLERSRQLGAKVMDFTSFLDRSGQTGTGEPRWRCRWRRSPITTPARE